MPLMPRLGIPPNLRPQRQMERNAPCWCESGKKWKHCHKDRHLLQPVNYFKVKEEMTKSYSIGTCSHPDAPSGCSGKAIRSHTIQRGGGLTAIAENGHVYSGREAINRIHQNQGAIVPQKTGIKSASTFPGFCSPHDTSLFLPIESGQVELTRQTAFLLSYRAMAYERHAKRTAVENLEASRMADSGRPFEQQAAVQQQLADVLFGMRAGAADLDRWKSNLDQMYRTGDNSPVGLYATVFDDLLPFVSAFAQQPELDFYGRRLQWLDALIPDQASLTVTVVNGKTVAVFTWLEGTSSAGARLAKSFDEVPHEDKATALLRYALSSSENVHMRPSWYEGLDEPDRADLLKLVRIGLPELGGPSPKLAGFDKGTLRLASVGSASHWL